MAAEEIFKPPLAEGALTVNVTSGCSYNRCAFCTMYHGEPFRALPLDAARAELAAARRKFTRTSAASSSRRATPSRCLPRASRKSRGLCMNFTPRRRLHASPRYTT